MRLKFKGIVESGDDSRCSGDGDCKDGAIFIGGVDVVAEMSNHSGRFTFGIADDRFDGDLFVETGWGYSEYTPMESDTLRVGDHDLIEILRRHEGKEITLFAFNEPSNMLDDSEWREVKTEEENSNSSQQANTAICGTCGGSGVVDSGGQEPWGQFINVQCPECRKQQ